MHAASAAESRDPTTRSQRRRARATHSGFRHTSRTSPATSAPAGKTYRTQSRRSSRRTCPASEGAAALARPARQMSASGRTEPACEANKDRCVETADVSEMFCSALRSLWSRSQRVRKAARRSARTRIRHSRMPKARKGSCASSPVDQNSRIWRQTGCSIGWWHTHAARSVYSESPSLCRARTSRQC